MKIAIDTNVLVRYLVNDDIKQATKARNMIEKAEEVIISLAVLCETVWVLSQSYHIDRMDIADALEQFIQESPIKVNQGAFNAGLELLRNGGDFADGLIAYEGQFMGANSFVTFDKKAEKLIKEYLSIKVQLL